MPRLLLHEGDCLSRHSISWLQCTTHLHRKRACQRRKQRSLYRCPQHVPHASAAQPGPSDASIKPSDTASWSVLTDRLVGATSIPFAILVLPQVAQNAVSIAAGNGAALSIISWEGYVTYLLGNALMASHFAARGEGSAVKVQLIGSINNLMVLAQVAYAAVMPCTIFFASLAVSVATAVISFARLNGSFQQRSLEGWFASPWRWWQLLSGICGFALLPQVLYNTFKPSEPSLIPGITAALAAAVWAWTQLGQGQDAATSGQLLDALPGYAATLLFALAPLPQLVRNFLDPGSLAALSIGTMLLALTGNSLMLPRALLTQDAIWFTGTAWAMLAGAGQIWSMATAVSSTTGLPYLDIRIAVGVSLVLLVFVGVVSWKDAKIKGLPTPWHTVLQLYKRS